MQQFHCLKNSSGNHNFPGIVFLYRPGLFQSSLLFPAQTHPSLYSTHSDHSLLSPFAANLVILQKTVILSAKYYFIQVLQALRLKNEIKLKKSNFFIIINNKGPKIRFQKERHV